MQKKLAKLENVPNRKIELTVGKYCYQCVIMCHIVSLFTDT